MATTHSPIKGATIPEEFRCNPYNYSPSGDPFFADKRNVEAVSTAFQNDDTVDSLVLFNINEVGEYFNCYYCPKETVRKKYTGYEG